MRLLVFPYGYDCEPIIRHAGLLEPCYQIAALVSPGDGGCLGSIECWETVRLPCRYMSRSVK